MRERPIPFSRPMVRAILAGTKTQTRRVVKPQPEHPHFASRHMLAVDDEGVDLYLHSATLARAIRCPYGRPGDWLWGREAYRLCAEADAVKPRDTDAAYRVWYEADAPHQPGAGKLRPGMFMPRWASRITLENTAVRLERLQDISEADAIAEGVHSVQCNDLGAEVPYYRSLFEPVALYRMLWESINGPGSWAANPWVWVVEFKPQGGDHGPR